MKKYIASAASLLIYLFNPIPAVVFADVATGINVCPNGGMFGSLCIDPKSIGSLLGNAFNLAAIVATLIAVGYLIYGGVKWITSQGEKTQVESARNHIVAAVIGLIIVFVAFLLVNVILQIFGVQGTTNLKIPSLVPQSTPIPPV